MPQLLTLQGPQSGQVYPISDHLTLGTIQDSQILLSDSKIITPVEINIWHADAVYKITHKQGNMPLLVNGQEIAEATLTHGDTISIGSHLFLFNDSPHSEETQDLLKALALLPSPEQEQNRQLLAFYQLSSMVSTVFDLKKLLHHLATFLIETFQAARTLVFLKHADQEYLKLSVYKTRLEQMEWKFLKSLLSPKILRLVTKYHKGVLCSCQYGDRFSSLMVTPLMYQNELMGMVVVETPSKNEIFVEQENGHAFTLNDLHTLGGMSLIAANGIANLQRYLEKKKHLHRLESLNKATLKLSSLLDVHAIYKESAHEVCKLLECGQSSIIYLDAQHNLRVGYAVGVSKDKVKHLMLPHGQGPIGWVVENGKALISEEIPEIFAAANAPSATSQGSCLAVPISDRSSTAAKIIGVLCAIHSHGTPFSKHDQELLKFIANQVGIALLNASLYEQATVDFLTRVQVRGYFFEQFYALVACGQQNNEPLSLLMLDIDHFKHFNDTYGHQAGDHILQELGSLIKSCIREGDLAGRYGGEEFIMALPMTDYEQAIKTAERLLNAVAAHTFQVKESSFHITVSIGVAQLQGVQSAEELLAQCDRALYQAKNNGRNRVC